MSYSVRIDKGDKDVLEMEFHTPYDAILAAVETSNSRGVQTIVCAGDVEFTVQPGKCTDDESMNVLLGEFFILAIPGLSLPEGGSW